MEKIIVVGNGIAGYTVASSLAKAGVDVVQYSEEPYGFYSRIKLPQALCDKAALDALPAQSEPSFIVHHNVVSLDVQGKKVRLDDGEEVSYDKLVLATGSRGRTLPQFCGIGNVSTLRTLADAEELSKAMKSPVCVLGGGLLGIEAARAIMKKGFSVTVLEGAPHILNRQLDATVSGILKQKLEKEGLTIKEGFSLDKVEGDAQSIKSVIAKDGTVVPCGTMVLSLGVNPETSLAKEAGITVERGIVVDETMRSSNPDVFAVGDCAQFQGMVPGIMPVALAQATVAVSQILGKAATYIPQMLMTRLKDDSFDLISIGKIEGEAKVKQEENSLASCFVEDGKLCGAILLNQSALLSRVKQELGKPFTSF